VETLLSEAAPDGFARVYLTAGDGTACAAADCCRLFVFVEPRPPVAPEIYARGYDLAFAPETCRPLFGGLKTANYWANLDALNRARPADEALLFNEAGGLISACMANVFIVRDGKIRTPALSCGARAGIVRDWVLQRRPVEERVMGRDDLECADEIFLTSSWIGVMPVASLEGRALPALAAAARSLRAEYERELQQAPARP
jgi:branched-subunit amino acid aminotransferase/4-amino-4-deoxychorismate lyase